MRKVYIIILIMLTCSFAVCGLLAAADWYREDRTTNTVSVGNLSAEIIDIYEQNTVTMPGDTVSKVVSVKNTGGSDAIVRVRLTGTWTDSGEETVPEQLSYEINEEDWLYDNESGYYYCTSVLAPGDVSAPLIRSFSLNGPNINNVFSGRPGCITVAMEAVQAAAGGVSIWGRTNEDLNIEYGERPSSGEGNESDVTFNGSAGGFDFGDNSDLFSTFKDLLPGQTVIQNISVGNSHDESTEIFLKAECSAEGNDELLFKLLTEFTDIEIAVGGETVYDGPLWQKEGGADVRIAMEGAEEERNADFEELYGRGISLGVVDAGHGKAITVELKLSPDAGNEFQDLAGDVDWIFYAKGSDREPVPQTGDNDTGIYVWCMSAAAALCIILIIVHRIVAGKKRENSTAKVKNKARGYRRIQVCIALLAAAAAVVSLSAAGTVAFMTDAETAENTIVPGTLSIELDEPGFSPGAVLNPKSKVPKDPKVTNTGSVPMIAYMKVGIPVKRVATVSGETKMIIPAAEQELFSFVPDNSWNLIESYTTGGNDGIKRVYYVFGYVEKILEPGESSKPLFSDIEFVNLLEGELVYASEIEVPVSAFGLQEKHIAEERPMAERVIFGYENSIKGAWEE